MQTMMMNMEHMHDMMEKMHGTHDHKKKQDMMQKQMGKMMENMEMMMQMMHGKGESDGFKNCPQGKNKNHQHE